MLVLFLMVVNVINGWQGDVIGYIICLFIDGVVR